jgi:pantothenate kinase
MPKEISNLMEEYDDLATELRQRVALLARDKQFWLGIAGAPGSGKSTFADALQERLGQILVVIPMDGYHYYRRELDAMDDPSEAYVRRGAPFTFNSERFVNDLIFAHEAGEGIFPSFAHGIGDPVEAQIELSRTQRIALVEGNYVLLDSEPWCQLHKKVFDETWFLDLPVSESNRRVLLRHIKSGLTEEQARLRIVTNDNVNAELISKESPGNADRLIQIF